jgi:hypothetical protein
MSVSSYFARWATRVAAVAVFAWTGTSARAADVAPGAPPAGIAAPVSVGGGWAPGCETCQHGIAKGHCNTCGKLLTWDRLHKDKKAMYPVNLCPGACFGYFQTQWRKWDEVCPYPYLGIGVNDSMRLPGGVTPVAPPRPGELTPPRPFDPKMMDPKKVGSNTPLLPSIPVAPAPMTSKFGP